MILFFSNIDVRLSENVKIFQTLMTQFECIINIIFQNFRKKRVNFDNIVGNL